MFLDGLMAVILCDYTERVND